MRPLNGEKEYSTEKAPLEPSSAARQQPWRGDQLEVVSPDEGIDIYNNRLRILRRGFIVVGEDTVISYTFR